MIVPGDTRLSTIPCSRKQIEKALKPTACLKCIIATYHRQITKKTNHNSNNPITSHLNTNTKTSFLPISMHNHPMINPKLGKKP